MTTTFSVILEDISKVFVAGAPPSGVVNQDNQRVETIDAEDIAEAWVLARQKYYVQKVDGPNTQIVDIQTGEVELKAALTAGEHVSVPNSTTEAPPIPVEARIHG